jgi:hypothetical protein
VDGVLTATGRVSNSGADSAVEVGVWTKMRASQNPTATTVAIRPTASRIFELQRMVLRQLWAKVAGIPPHLQFNHFLRFASNAERRESDAFTVCVLLVYALPRLVATNA